MYTLLIMASSLCLLASVTDVVTFLDDTTDLSITNTLAELTLELTLTSKIRETVGQVRYRHERLGNLVGEGRDKLALHALSGQILSGHITIDVSVVLLSKNVVAHPSQIYMRNCLLAT